MSSNHNYIQVWKDQYKVHSYEVDFSGSATLASLCRFMQESAWTHAEHLDVGFTQLMKKNLIWVLSRQTVQVNDFPKWGDTVQIHTWPSGQDRLFCYRDFKIIDEQGNIKGVATTTWFVIDLEKRRPQRVNSYLKYLPDNAELVFPNFSKKIKAIQSPNSSQNLRVNYSDLDVNGHANNVKYIEYIMDSLPFDFLKSQQLFQFEINYLAEAFYDDEIFINLKDSGSGEFLHNIIRKKDNIELCRAKTYWGENARRTA